MEEQFYIIFPLYLYAAMRLTRRPLAITAVIALLSFASCVLLTPMYQPLAFYALPTRAWELLIGASLALYRSNGGRLNYIALHGAAWGGLALIVGSIVALHETSGFPGWIALFPVLGTALVIAPIGLARPVPLRLLAHPAMVAVGKRSYSLYLWHWPVFSLIDYHFYAQNAAVRIALKIIVTVGLTLLSYSFVERPARRYLNVRQRRVPMFAMTALAAILVAGGGLWMRSALYFDVAPNVISSGGHTVSGGDRATVILSGDSQAAMYGTEIGAIAETQHFTLHALGTAGRNQLPGEAGTSWPLVATLIADKNPDLVILSDAWTSKLRGDPTALARALAQIAGHAKAVLLVAEAPTLPANTGRDALRAGLKPLVSEPPAAKRARLASLALLRTLERPNVSVVDVSDLFVDPIGRIRLAGPDGRLVYFDPHHLSDTGTALTHARLDQAIRQALKGQTRG